MEGEGQCLEGLLTLHLSNAYVLSTRATASSWLPVEQAAEKACRLCRKKLISDVWPVLSKSTSFDTLSCQETPRIPLRHLLWNGASRFSS